MMKSMVLGLLISSLLLSKCGFVSDNKSSSEVNNTRIFAKPTDSLFYNDSRLYVFVLEDTSKNLAIFNTFGNEFLFPSDNPVQKHSSDSVYIFFEKDFKKDTILMRLDSDSIIKYITSHPVGGWCGEECLVKIRPNSGSVSFSLANLPPIKIDVSRYKYLRVVYNNGDLVFIKGNKAPRYK